MQNRGLLSIYCIPARHLLGTEHRLGMSGIVTGETDVRNIEITEYEYTKENAAGESDVNNEEMKEEKENDE